MTRVRQVVLVHWESFPNWSPSRIKENPISSEAEPDLTISAGCGEDVRDTTIMPREVRQGAETPEVTRDGDARMAEPERSHQLLSQVRDQLRSRHTKKAEVESGPDWELKYRIL
ncbi:hypothetical protein NDU88_003474 [Pleurodeles waltl]|uniref:Uncharacterized protein n=1 Tax=Pleurodeles waltl TaxID=8319 RepID=A0AAV7SDL9_PLEWA|nr:hypothetical protein NDU88_003474 [Pleurodeles waltl]